MKKRMIILLLSCLLTLSFSASAFAESWNISASESNFYHVRSQGTIDIDFLGNTVEFDGWASSIFEGGWGADIEMMITAKTYVSWLNGNSSTNTTTKTQTVDGTNQVNVSVTVLDPYAASGLLTSCRVYANGYLKFLPPYGDSSTYWSLDATGDRGWN